MNYKLKAGEKLPDGIRRVARKQMARAARRLRKDDSDARGTSLHEARQWLKKARATLRLVRPALGGRVCEREDRKLREVARGLARRRDAEVLVMTLESLRSGGRELAEDRVWERLQQIFLKRREKHSEGLRAQKRKCGKALNSSRRRVKEWPLKKLRWTDLCRGAGKVYRQGRDAQGRAELTRATEDLHKWRKRVKELWYGLQILEPELPRAMGNFAERMKDLGELLGNDHDLAMLEAALKTCGLEAGELKAVVGRVRTRRAGLQQTAFKLGRRLFAEEPEQFVRRMSKG
jgi:CHAD domain-containing protein